MSIITITSDFGYKDYYVSSLKAKILSKMRSATIVDVSHGISEFNIKEGYFVLNSVFREFPEGSIHIFAVNEEGYAHDKKKFAFTLEKHFFVCTGKSFVLQFDQLPEVIVELPDSENSISALELFSKTATDLAQGKILSEVGTETTIVKNSISSDLSLTTNEISGAVIYIDNYGNGITNINKAHYDQVGQGRSFIINFGRYNVDTIHRAYYEKEDSEMICRFNQNGHLVISSVFGGGSRLFNITNESRVKITFK